MSNQATSAVNWDDVKEAYAQGAADVEIARLLGITLGRFYSLYEANPSFSEFVDSGRTLSQAWWYEQSRKGLWNRSFNTSLFNFVMKNRFGWADKVESADTTDKDPANLDQIKAQVSGAMAKLAATNPELFSGVNLHTSAKQKGEND